MNYDVFNGDADGLCALQQLRLTDPLDSFLVTGVKRDIRLLERVDAVSGDAITVLDISLDSNRSHLQRALANGASVQYFDHHFAGEIPEHPKLAAHIDTSPDTCTSLLVNAYLSGRCLAWAAVGAFGDNFDVRARAAAQALRLENTRLLQLRELGILLNYNAYGRTIADLHVPPDELFRRLHPYTDPLAFIADGATFADLRDGYAEDMAKAERVEPESVDARCAVYLFPAVAWAHRVSGVFANRLAKRSPERAHALLVELEQGGYLVSVRAPLQDPRGADALCRSFPTGGGRKAAAGINRLPEASLAVFVREFRAAYGRGS